MHRPSAHTPAPPRRRPGTVSPSQPLRGGGRSRRGRAAGARAGVCLAVLVLAASCADVDAPARAPGTTVDTMPDGRRIVANPAPPADAGARLDEVRRIGSAAGEGPDLFGRILDVELGPDGEILVLDGQAEEIRVFDTSGTHLRTLGRPGEGPGELSRPAGIALDGGRVWVMNWGNARFTAFDLATGGVVEERPRRASFGMFPWPGGVDRGGRLVDVGLSSDGEPAVLALDDEGVPTDTLALPADPPEGSIRFLQGERMMMSMALPFVPRPSWVPHPDGGIWTGPGSPYRLHHVAPGGDTLRTVSVARPPVEIPDPVRDSVAEVLAGRVAEVRDEGLRTEGEVRLPRAYASIEGLAIDAAGRVWVSVPGPDGRRRVWDVLAPDGTFVGSVAIPDDVEITSAPAIRGDLLALSALVDGVPRVIVYRIVGLGGG